MNRNARSIFCLPAAVAALLVLVCGISLHGQSTYTGQLSGEVTDSSGAVIAGAKITLTDTATNTTTTATTDTKGVYVLTGLRPGTYDILVEAANLGSVERKDVVLAVSQQANVNFTLSPGTVTTSVEVPIRLRCWTPGTPRWVRTSPMNTCATSR